MQKVRVWDLPLRLFHWSLALAVIGAFICIKAAAQSSGWFANAGIDWMYWHTLLGYTTVALILFRLIWGIIGPKYARFAQFIRGPGAILAYFRGDYQGLGHNPLGAFSVIALLLVFGFQGFSGLFIDDFLWPGPLAYLSSAWSKTLTSLHRQNELLMIILFALHIGAILYYRLVQKRNLVPAMITGDSIAPSSQSHLGIRDNFAVFIRGLIVFAICAGFVYYLTTLGGGSVDSFM